MKRGFRSRMRLVALGGMLMTLDTIVILAIVPPVVRAVESGRARAWLETGFHVSRALSRAAFATESEVAAALAQDAPKEFAVGRVLTREIERMTPRSVTRTILCRGSACRHRVKFIRSGYAFEETQPEAPALDPGSGDRAGADRDPSLGPK